jgi:hypothetical protein
MLGTVPVVGLGAMDLAKLLGGVGWLRAGLDKVGEPVGEAAFDEAPVAFAEADPSGCTDATAEAAECDGADPLHATVSTAKATIYIRLHRFLCCDRSFVLSSADRHESLTFNSPTLPPGDRNHFPRD